MTTGIDFATGEAKRVSCYAKTKQEAVKLLNTMTFINNTSPKSFEAVTLGDWLELCLETYMKPSLKQSTYLSYESYIRVHFKPALGDVLLRDVNPRLLQTFYNYKLYEQGLSPKTVVNMNLFLHKALDFALGEGYIQGNPTEAINLPHGQKPPIKILTRDEQARLMQGSYMHRYGVFIRLTLFTGIRIGELLGLRWTDVDLQGSKININQTLNRLNKIGAVTPGESTTEIVVQSPNRIIRAEVFLLFRRQLRFCRIRCFFIFHRNKKPRKQLRGRYLIFYAVKYPCLAPLPHLPFIKLSLGPI